MTSVNETDAPIDVALDDVFSYDPYEYLNQDVLWLSQSGVPMWVDKMDITHAREAAHYLLSHSTGFILVCEAALSVRIYDDTETTLSDVLKLISQRPQEWIRTTPLFQALQLRARV